MEKFIFKGNWTPTIELKEFICLTNSELINRLLKEKQLQGLFKVQITDFTDNNPDPFTEQINAVNFLINNQIKILKSLLNYIKNEIYPKYKTFISQDEYPDSYPELNTIDDLFNLLAINEVFINTESKESSAYIVFSFNSCLDYEHGLCITMHENRCIDWCEMGNLDNEKILLDGGRTDVSKTNFDDAQVNYDGVFSPNKKFNNLKPWQVDFAEDTFKKLLKSKESAKIIELIDKANWTVETKFPLSYVDLTYLSCNYLNKDVAEYLIKKGANIDSLNYWCETGLLFNIKNFADSKWQASSYKENNLEKFNLYENQANSYIPKIKLFLELGANPESCNIYKESYKQILIKKWREDFLISSGIIENIESFLKIDTNNSNS